MPVSCIDSHTPEGWQIVRLGDIAKESNQRGNSVPHAEVFSVTKYAGFVRSLEYFDRQVFSRDTSNYKLVQRGDLAYATIHLDEGSLGIFRHAVAGLISPMYTVFEADKARIDPEFLFALMKLPQMVARYRRIGEGSVHRRKSIQFDRLARLSFPIPPLPEQRTIANILDSIDHAIEATDALVSATEQLRDSLLHNLLTRGLPGRHTEWKEVPGLGTIPANWEVMPLGNGVKHVGSGVTPRGGKSAYAESGVTFLRSQNVHFDGLRLQDVAYITSETDASMRRSRVCSGDVLLNITGASIGRCTIVPPDLGSANVNQHVCIIRVTEDFNPTFVSMWLSTSRAQREIDDVQAGQSRQGLNYQQVRLLTIARPSRAEQDAMATILEGVIASIRRNNTAKNVLKTLKESASDALLTGRVRVD